MNHFSQIRRIVRQLRYRTLDDVLNQQITIQRLDTVVQDVQQALPLLREAPFLSPERCFMEGATRKYGLLDLEFAAPESLREGEFQHGIALLKRLGFVPAKRDRRPDPDGLDYVVGMFDESLGRWVIKLLLEDAERLRLPPRERYSTPTVFPCTFSITDACLANSDFVWFLRHFYW